MPCFLLLQEDTLNESRLLARVQHPNVVRYIDSFIQKAHLHIVMEYAPKGDLAQWLKRAQAQGEGACLLTLASVLLLASYLVS